MRRTEFLTLLAVLLISMTALVGCSNARSSIRIGWVSINSGADQKVARYATFTGRESALVRLTPGQTLNLDYVTEVNKGALSIAVLNPNNQVIWEVFLEAGRNDSVELNAEQGGTYELVIEGQNTSGRFDVSWDVEN